MKKDLEYCAQAHKESLPTSDTPHASNTNSQVLTRPLPNDYHNKLLLS